VSVFRDIHLSKPAIDKEEGDASKSGFNGRQVRRRFRVWEVIPR
jgi:hypothetical protein